MSPSLRVLVLVLSSVLSAQSALEDEAREFLNIFDEEASKLMYNYSLASWAYNTDISQENSDKVAEQGAIWGDFYAKMSAESEKYPIAQIKNREIKLQLISLQDKGSGVLSPEKQAHLSKVMNEMSTIYSTAIVCLLDEPFKCHTLEPGLEEVMFNSKDYWKRLHVWEGWRQEVGKRMRPLYEDYVDLKNEAAKLNGFEDYGAYWRYNYETVEEEEEKYTYTRDELMHDVRKIYQQTLPLYKELHAYVRARLMEVYPGHIDAHGPLPAHLLGDMWGRFWTNLYPMATPYPKTEDIDVTDTMKKQKWEPIQFFAEAEKFFMSVGLYPMYSNFWTNSMFVKPEDGRTVVCHPTAWDMGNRKDFRIKMCTKINMDDFLVVHHEMGHNQYQMAYQNLSYLLRDGANEGFHEAVGEIMSLSAATPSHLQSLGLLPSNFTGNSETDINFLLKQALSIVATLPFTYQLEEWRWQVFSGNISKDQWMKTWWQMKREMVGVVEPVPHDETYCDPPALFHVSGDYSFIRYFTRTIYQFQFQKALCDAAGHKGDLFKCDITNSTEAGTKLRAMLELGRNQSWTQALETISGHTRMDAQPLLDYFHKLEMWLKEENSKHGRTVGWNPSIDPYSANGIKVRISLKAAMGDNAYQWNDNELFLFKASIAYALKQYYQFQKNATIQITSEHVDTFDETPRISFYIAVKNPAAENKYFPREEVEAAIRMSRGRINDAFQLSDSTLEFVGVPPTLAPPIEQPVEVWLVVFGAVMGIVVLAGIFLVVSGIRERKKKSKETVVENPYNSDGISNKGFDSENEQTGF